MKKIILTLALTLMALFTNAQNWNEETRDAAYEAPNSLLCKKWKNSKNEDTYLFAANGTCKFTTKSILDDASGLMGTMEMSGKFIRNKDVLTMTFSSVNTVPDPTGLAKLSARKRDELLSAIRQAKLMSTNELKNKKYHMLLLRLDDEYLIMATCDPQSKKFNDYNLDIWYNETHEKKELAKISKTCPDDHHPHMIDLGLPSGTKWACCNVDTDHPEKQSPTNYGGYYAWGETETKNVYYFSTYKYYQNEKYVDIGRDIAGTEYDVARVKWGDDWHIPTIDQMEELTSNCVKIFTTINGVNGYEYISMINSARIFLPAAGSFEHDSFKDSPNLKDVGSFGYYWSSTQHPSEKGKAYYIIFNSFRTERDYYNREDGHSVRPVGRN